jgi:diguanylate cyclase (GGDEF)-like protein
VLPDTAERKASSILDRLRAIVAELDWSALSPGMRVTISAGVALLRPGENTDSLLARADTALYASKGRGRNRITAA